jgi:hypothetical protein
MIRLLFCIAAVLLSSATAVFAAPLQIAPSSPAQSMPPAQTYAWQDQYQDQDYVQPDYYARQNYARYSNPVVLPTPQSRPLSATRITPAHVYLLRGFMNVFSLGMDDLGDRLRADGMATTVTNHADADYLVSQIVANYQAGDHSPIVLIGHSLGADAVITMAQALNSYGVPVALAVLFDGTAPHQVPNNVTTAINFTKAFSISPGAGFHGALSNIDLSNNPAIDHLSIDKSPSLQATTIDYVLQAAQAGQTPPSKVSTAIRH